jgi:ELMO/CED-12 family
VEFAQHALVTQSQQDVLESLHQPLLDEIWSVVFPDDSLSIVLSEKTLMDESKPKVDWVKLGFQGKSPKTDFRATGTSPWTITEQVTSD